MEMRVDTFNRRQMRAVVESRLASKIEPGYSIVEPLTYSEYSEDIPRSEAETRGKRGPFTAAASNA